MASKPGPLAVIGKWLIVPVLLALLGYFVIGPRIGKPSDDSKKSPDVTVDSPNPATGSTAANTHESVSNATGSSSSSGQSEAPDMDISVRPVRRRYHANNSDDSSPSSVTSLGTHRAIHRRIRHRQADEMTPKPKPDTGGGPPDEGGSAGATTAG